MEHIVPTFKHGGGSVMVWLYWSERSWEIIQNDRCNAEDYKRKILIPLVRKSMNSCTGLPLNQAIFRQDNAPIHTAKVRHCSCFF